MSASRPEPDQPSGKSSVGVGGTPALFSGQLLISRTDCLDGGVLGLVALACATFGAGRLLDLLLFGSDGVEHIPRLRHQHI